MTTLPTAINPGTIALLYFNLKKSVEPWFIGQALASIAHRMGESKIF